MRPHGRRGGYGIGGGRRVAGLGCAVPESVLNAAHGEPEVLGVLRRAAASGAGAELRGSLDDAREDDGYVVEMAIPWASFSPQRLGLSPSSFLNTTG
jgi:hypothetical protein